MRNDYDHIFIEKGEKYNLEPALLKAQGFVESGLNPNAVSPVGAVGLPQLMPATAKSLGVKDSRDPEQAIDAQARLMRENLQRTGNIEDAMRMYHGGTNQKNWGPLTNSYPEKILKNLEAARASMGNQDILQEFLGEDANRALADKLKSFDQPPAAANNVLQQFMSPEAMSALDKKLAEFDKEPSAPTNTPAPEQKPIDQQPKDEGLGGYVLRKAGEGAQALGAGLVQGATNVLTTPVLGALGGKASIASSLDPRNMIPFMREDHQRTNQQLGDLGRAATEYINPNGKDSYIQQGTANAVELLPSLLGGQAALKAVGGGARMLAASKSMPSLVSALAGKVGSGTNFLANALMPNTVGRAAGYGAGSISAEGAKQEGAGIVGQAAAGLIGGGLGELAGSLATKAAKPAIGMVRQLINGGDGLAEQSVVTLADTLKKQAQQGIAEQVADTAKPPIVSSATEQVAPDVYKLGVGKVTLKPQVAESISSAMPKHIQKAVDDLGIDINKSEYAYALKNPKDPEVLKVMGNNPVATTNLYNDMRQFNQQAQQKLSVLFDKEFAVNNLDQGTNNAYQFGQSLQQLGDDVRNVAKPMIKKAYDAARMEGKDVPFDPEIIKKAMIESALENHIAPKKLEPLLKSLDTHVDDLPKYGKVFDYNWVDAYRKQLKDVDFGNISEAAKANIVNPVKEAIDKVITGKYPEARKVFAISRQFEEAFDLIGGGNPDNYVKQFVSNTKVADKINNVLSTAKKIDPQKTEQVEILLKKTIAQDVLNSLFEKPSNAKNMVDGGGNLKKHIADLLTPEQGQLIENAANIAGYFDKVLPGSSATNVKLTKNLVGDAANAYASIKTADPTGLAQSLYSLAKGAKKTIIKDADEHFLKTGQKLKAGEGNPVPRSLLQTLHNNHTEN